jgi:hypothetical protein
MPYGTNIGGQAWQSSATRCPEQSEGSPLSAGRSFDPPAAASGGLALQVGLPLGRELEAERLRGVYPEPVEGLAMTCCGNP